MARLKNDKVDAAILAQLLRADLLPEAWIAPLPVRQDLAPQHPFPQRRIGAATEHALAETRLPTDSNRPTR